MSTVIAMLFSDFKEKKCTNKNYLLLFRSIFYFFSFLVVGCGLDDGGTDIPEPELIDEVVILLQANAGEDQTVDAFQNIFLDGSKSTVPEGEVKSYSWEFTALPDGLDVAPTFSDVTSERPFFTVSHPGVYTIQVTLEDGDGNFSMDTVLVTVDKTLPTSGQMMGFALLGVFCLRRKAIGK